MSKNFLGVCTIGATLVNAVIPNADSTIPNAPESDPVTSSFSVIR